MNAKTRKILFLDHTAQLGGAELSLARYLRHAGGQRAVLGILAPDSVESWRLPRDVNVSHTTARAGTDGISRIVRELRELIDAIDPICIVANSYSAAQYLAFVPKRGRTYLYFLRQEALPAGLSRVKRMLNHGFVLRRFDGYFANSEWTADTVPASIRAHRRVKITHPISGISKSVRRAKPFDSGRLGLLTLSRLSPWKGVHTAIEAFEMLHGSEGPHISLTVAGGDLFGEQEYSARLRSMSLSGSVDFVGHLSDVEDLLVSNDVLLCLSVTPEPFGQIVVQGMARGMVVIATDQGGPREIIEHGATGFLVPPESPDQVRDVVMRLIREPGLFDRVSAASVKEAEKYLDGATIAGFDRALSSLTAGSRT